MIWYIVGCVVGAFALYVYLMIVGLAWEFYRLRRSAVQAENASAITMASMGLLTCLSVLFILGVLGARQLYLLSRAPEAHAERPY